MTLDTPLILRTKLRTEHSWPWSHKGATCKRDPSGELAELILLLERKGLGRLLANTASD